MLQDCYERSLSNNIHDICVIYWCNKTKPYDIFLPIQNHTLYPKNIGDKIKLGVKINKKINQFPFFFQAWRLSLNLLYIIILNTNLNNRIQDNILKRHRCKSLRVRYKRVWSHDNRKNINWWQTLCTDKERKYKELMVQTSISCSCVR